jgi:hypothetical protein
VFLHQLKVLRQQPLGLLNHRQRPGFQGVKGDIVVRGIDGAGQDHNWCGFQAQNLARGLQAIHVRHANVHGDDIGLQTQCQADGFLSIGGLPDDLDIGRAFQHCG